MSRVGAAETATWLRNFQPFEQETPMILTLFLVCSLLPSGFGLLNAVKEDTPAKSSKVIVAVEMRVPGVRALNLVKPAVPEATTASGRVVVQVKVKKDGSATPVKIQSTDPLLSSLAENAVKSSLFAYKPRSRQSISLGTLTYIFALTETTQADLNKLLGREVAIAGEFSIGGKFGPIISFSESIIYVVPSGYKTHIWGAYYSKLEGNRAVFIGKLLFRPAFQPLSNPERPVSSSPAYFYFAAETTKVLPFNP